MANIPNLTQAVQPPQFPQTSANVSYPQGIQITVTLAPGIALSVTVGPDAVEQWLALWQSGKQQHSKELQIIQHIQNGKNG